LQQKKISKIQFFARIKSRILTQSSDGKTLVGDVQVLVEFGCAVVWYRGVVSVDAAGLLTVAAKIQFFELLLNYL